MIRAVAIGHAIPLTEGPRDALPWPQFGFPVTRFALIGGIAQ